MTPFRRLTAGSNATPRLRAYRQVPRCVPNRAQPSLDRPSRPDLWTSSCEMRRHIGMHPLSFISSTHIIVHRTELRGKQMFYLEHCPRLPPDDAATPSHDLSGKAFGNVLWCGDRLQRHRNRLDSLYGSTPVIDSRSDEERCQRVRGRVGIGILIAPKADGSLRLDRGRRAIPPVSTGELTAGSSRSHARQHSRSRPDG